MSIFDQIFKGTCLKIFEIGIPSSGNVRTVWEDTGEPAHYISIVGVQNRYNLREEFPISTQRYANLFGMVDELLWIFQKKSNNISELNSNIWDQWADENGSIGRAYGYQIGKKSRYKEGLFDQIDRVLFLLKNDPNSRQIMTEIFIPEDLHLMGLPPCVHNTHWLVKDGRLNLVLNQRSQDMLAANCWNVSQYAVLCHMLAQVSGLGVGELIHNIDDCHIYDRHIELVKELIDRPSYPAPKLIIDPDIKDFYDFRPESFKLENYQHGEPMRGIPVAV